MARAYVLVHGMSHGAWCWELVSERLARNGHHVLTLDLPGHGRRAGEWRRASVQSYAHSVADAMAREGVRDAVLVGHSMAGIVIPKVAELVPARVGHIVFLAAVVLPTGSSLDHQLPLAAREIFAGSARAGGGVVQYPAAMAQARWLGDLPPGDDRVTRALTLLTPQPLRPWRQRVDMRAFNALALPRTYIRCLRDAAIPPARGAEYAARLGVTPIDLDSDHGPMLSHPDELTKILETV
jgi:pimeloyl-ACP methyl ester carboxylesterase